MKLRPEYEKIRCTTLTDMAGVTIAAVVRIAVEACQELADKPPKELTGAEINSLVAHWNISSQGTYDFIRTIESAVHAKQKEPAEIPFDYEKWKTGEWVAVAPEGLIAEVISPLRQYTMRRKS